MDREQQKSDEKSDKAQKQSNKKLRAIHHSIARYGTALGCQQITCNGTLDIVSDCCLKRIDILLQSDLFPPTDSGVGEVGRLSRVDPLDIDDRRLVRASSIGQKTPESNAYPTQPLAEPRPVACSTTEVKQILPNHEVNDHLCLLVPSPTCEEKRCR
jgi:hypothetical protein